MSIIKIICGTCKRDLGEKDGEGQTGISHGMCAECFKLALAEIQSFQIRTISNEKERGGE